MGQIRQYPPLGHGLDKHMKGFGERLRKIRTEQNLTVKQLSGLSKVPEKTIYRIETGEVADPRVSSVVPIIKALNCSADEVIFDPEDFPQFAKLRKVFLKYGELREEQQDLLVEVIQKITLGMSMEAYLSEAFAKGEYEKIG